MEEATRKKPKVLMDIKSNIKLLPGLIMVSIVAYISILVGNNIPLLGSTVVAILLGMLLRNFLSIPSTFEEGIQYSLKRILKLAIILLGINLNLWQLLAISRESIIAIIIVVGFGILFTLYISRFMNFSGNIPLLIGVGTAICGATAIATISPISKAKEEDTAIAISTIFIFNVIALIIYPYIGLFLGMSNEVFGMWSGLSIHDTSSAVAAGYSYSNDAGEISTVVKLTRTLFLAPVAIIIGFYMNKKEKNSNHELTKSKLHISNFIPLFLVGFIALSILTTIGIFSQSTVTIVTSISKFLILMAMVSIGMGVNFSKLKKVGVKPIYLGLVSSIVVGIVSLALIYIVV